MGSGPWILVLEFWEPRGFWIIFWIFGLWCMASGPSGSISQSPFSRLSSFDINVWGDAELNILGDELDEEFLLLIGEPFLEHSAENMTEPAVPKIPEFHGTPEENLSDWVETLDSIFEIAPKEENQRYKYARAHIRNAALALLTGFVGDKWSELKAHLLKLDPHGNQLAATAALFDLQQGGSSLDAYYKACAARFGRIKPPMAKEEQLRWYLRGLDPALKGYLPAVDLSGTLSIGHIVLPDPPPFSPLARSPFPASIVSCSDTPRTNMLYNASHSIQCAQREGEKEKEKKKNEKNNNLTFFIFTSNSTIQAD